MESVLLFTLKQKKETYVSLPLKGSTDLTITEAQSALP